MADDRSGESQLAFHGYRLKNPHNLAAGPKTAGGRLMNTKALQKQYREGKITKEQYQAKLQELLDGEEITQEQHDEAAEFNPEDDKPIFTQADVDGMILPKAKALLKKALREAGVELPEGATSKNLVDEVAKLAAAGVGKGQATDTELLALRKKAARVDELDGTMQNLTLENHVMRAASKYKPVNVAQVVRALGDYKDLLQHDDDGVLIPKSVDAAIKRIAQAEPNLFHANDPEGDGADGNDGGKFKGKSPGGGSGGNGDNADMEARKNEMLTLMGQKPKN